MTLCWVIISTTAYHNARMGAFCQHGGATPHLLQWTDTDEFAPLRLQNQPGEGYGTITLLPGRSIDDVSLSERRRALDRALCRVRPSVVCVNGWGMPGSRDVLAWCVARHVPAVLMSESTMRDASRSRWREGVKRRLVRLCASALVGGTLHRDYIINLGMPAERVFMGYDAVDNEHFRRGAHAARASADRLRRELQLPDHYFLACSRFTQKKNLLRLIEAYARYQRRAVDGAWELVIVGEGPLKQEMVALCQRLDVVDKVLLVGGRSYTDLPVYYGLAEAFVHASTTEQWGLVVNEAMAAGLPVLVSNRCGCTPELVQEGRNGYTFDPYDIDGLAALFGHISIDQGRRREFGAASEEIVGEWSPQQFAESLFQAMSTALSTPLSRIKLADRLLLSR
jgi:1,2-diacylglycerol 3-alpha-glucosyltransferase